MAVDRVSRHVLPDEAPLSLVKNRRVAGHAGCEGSDLLVEPHGFGWMHRGSGDRLLQRKAYSVEGAHQIVLAVDHPLGRGDVYICADGNGEKLLL